MKKTKFLLFLFLFVSLAVAGQNKENKPEEMIFVHGADINSKFVQYIVELTNKPNPKVCYIPTASADNERNIKYWEFICKQLSIEPHVLKVWVSSNLNTLSFEDQLLDMDAIVIGGGNTLNMIAIWKAQGIDRVLEKALEKGIIISGGSAGSICWFQNGISDSRPIKLSVVDGLGILPYSNCPHYGDSLRQSLYHELIGNKTMEAGYASDDKSGILFRNGKVAEVVSINDINNSYYVSLKNGVVNSEKLKARVLVDKNALPVNEYTKTDINKAVGDFEYLDDRSTPIQAYVDIANVLANGQNSKLKALSSPHLLERLGDQKDAVVSDERKNTLLGKSILSILNYKDSIAAIISQHSGFQGIWYFYKVDEQWLSAGEDMGGETLLESEIVFREKIKTHIDNLSEILKQTD